MTASQVTPERREELAAFYAAWQHSHRRAVARRARGAQDAIVADCCAYVWLLLVRRPDVSLDRPGFNWLTLVAVQEVWRQHKRVRPERPAGSFRADCDDEELREPASLHHDPLDQALAAETQRERVAHFAQLKARERRDLLLAASGYTYREIAEQTGSSYTVVNRRITEGRAQLRRVRELHAREDSIAQQPA